ncbi:MAG: DUF2783 domain-containing protein [Pseudomonadota bacterium]
MISRKRLVTAPNMPDADGFYERLLQAHKGLDNEASQALNARLVLVLANHIGDPLVLQDAIDLASKAGDGADGS